MLNIVQLFAQAAEVLLFTLGCNRDTVNALNIYLSRSAYNAIDKVLTGIKVRLLE